MRVFFWARDRVKQETTDAVVSIASKASYVASGGAIILGGFTLQEWAAIVGVMTAIGTFGVNWYYQHRRLQLVRQDVETVTPNGDG